MIPTDAECTLMGVYDEALRAEGVDLRIGQMNTLVVVIRDGTVKPSELCERMKIDASTVSRNVERLIARGLLIVQRRLALFRTLYDVS